MNERTEEGTNERTDERREGRKDFILLRPTYQNLKTISNENLQIRIVTPSLSTCLHFLWLELSLDGLL